MTKNQILDDLKYARDVAEQGQFAPLLGGRIGLMWGCLLVPTLLIHGGITAGHLDIPIEYIGAVWMAFGIGGGILSAILSKTIARKAGAHSIGNKVERLVWSGTTLILFTLAISIAFAVLVLNKPYELFDIIMAVAFGTQALAYYVLANISNNKALYFPMCAALGLMAVIVALVGNPNAYFIAGIGVIFTVIIPALTHLKNEPKNVV